MPAKIIILRHGEKANPFELCCTGVQRSLALAAQYLGNGAANSLFENGEAPAAFFAITLHTIETASPAAQSWHLPVTAFSAVPIVGSSYGDSDPVLDDRTREAATEVMDPKWKGKTLVMVWEHKRIANLDHTVMLRDLLNLSRLGGVVPAAWEGENYDFFWVVEYGADGQTPTSFSSIKQKFDAPYHGLPHNDWGKPADPKTSADCEP